jgi:hypothetical protein
LLELGAADAAPGGLFGCEDCRVFVMGAVSEQASSRIKTMANFKTILFLII